MLPVLSNAGTGESAQRFCSYSYEYRWGMRSSCPAWRERWLHVAPSQRIRKRSQNMCRLPSD
eukprot:scaffold10436_cov18-Prasinocladus_malaysianus.AAC.1